jgi:hypothetical protein
MVSQTGKPEYSEAIQDNGVNPRTLAGARASERLY